jgi:hypothetical protein
VALTQFAQLYSRDPQEARKLLRKGGRSDKRFGSGEPPPDEEGGTVIMQRPDIPPKPAAGKKEPPILGPS